jgi:TPR repeat protein
MYQKGDRVSKNLVEAHAWAAKAIGNGHEDGLILREQIEEDLNPSQLSQARQLFARWQIEPVSPIDSDHR